MRKDSTSEKLSSKASFLEAQQSLLTIYPGNYMMFDKNKMKRIPLKTQGLLVGNRIENDNHVVVLVDEHLILVPKI